MREIICKDKYMSMRCRTVQDAKWGRHERHQTMTLRYPGIPDVLATPVIIGPKWGGLRPNDIINPWLNTVGEVLSTPSDATLEFVELLGNYSGFHGISRRTHHVMRDIWNTIKTKGLTLFIHAWRSAWLLPAWFWTQLCPEQVGPPLPAHILTPTFEFLKP